MAGTEDQNPNRGFTFICYDVNARGVSDIVRSHLMEVRARNRRDAQVHNVESKPGQQYSALPWRFVEVEKKRAPQSRSQRQEAIGSNSLSQEALQLSRPVKSFNLAPSSSQVSSRPQSPKDSLSAETGSDKGSPTMRATDIDELTDRMEEQQCNSVSVPGTLTAILWQLSPPDLVLYQYFLANGATMLQFHPHWKMEIPHKPVEKIFLPIALSARWCFEVVVLLFSAYHHRRAEGVLQRAEDPQVTTIQYRVLKAARERITAIVESRDSNDADVLAFLFLAIIEFRFGDKEIGVMHLDAWQRYLVMRRECGVDACSARCKVAVWWCISMLLAPDDPLPTVLDCKMVERIREDPTRILKCLEAERSKAEEKME